jgi:lysophospholipase L1-like esterase
MSSRGGSMRLAASLAVSLAATSIADAAPTAPAVDMQPVRVLLVGDSTMAPQTGYGDALCERFRANVTCLNLAKGGRSSASYRAEGLWDKVLDLLRDGGQYKGTYVLIQFGHNDQPGKPGRSTDLKTEFPLNMTRYAEQVKLLGATPVLVTPLSRRIFKEGVLQNDLRPWADATIGAAAAEHVPVLDLNAESAAALAMMGEAAADTLAMAPPSANPDQTADAERAQAKLKGENYRGFDRTHLGLKGASLFATMVEQELTRAVPSMALDLKVKN